MIATYSSGMGSTVRIPGFLAFDTMHVEVGHRELFLLRVSLKDTDVFSMSSSFDLNNLGRVFDQGRSEAETVDVVTELRSARVTLAVLTEQMLLVSSANLSVVHRRPSSPTVNY
jgi:hypothetical protein